MEELVVGVSFPLRWLAPAGEHDARTPRRPVRSRFYGGGEVHGEIHRANHPFGMIDEANQLAQVRPPDQVQYARKSGLVVFLIPNLHKEDTTAECIHDFLIAATAPPLDRDIKLAACCNNPEWDFFPCNLPDLGHPLLLLGGQM